MYTKRKITYIISGINRSLAFEWINQKLDRSRFELSFILIFNGTPELKSILEQKGAEVFTIKYRNKWSIPLTLVRLWRLLFNIKPHVVHTHLFEATLFGSLISKILGIKKRIQTRHHATSNLRYHPNTVKWDKLCNSLSSTIIAPSNNVKETLVKYENVDESKVKVIYHGFDLDSIQNVAPHKIKDLRVKYNIRGEDGPIVGVLSRYLELKGIQYIIPAFQKLLVEYPKAKLIIGNARGPYKKEIRSKLEQIDPERYIEIEFENEIFALYRLFDIFIHVPIDSSVEAFGQIYIEALASKIPSIFTLSGIANEFVVPDHNAFVVAYKDANGIYDGMNRILSDVQYRDRLIQNGLSGLSDFELHIFVKRLEQLYE